MTNSRLNSDSSPQRRRRCWHLMYHWHHPSDTARHYRNVFLATVLFFIAQLLTCAWDQPFWKYGIEFPGQIVAMVFLWLFLWAFQLAFYHKGEGLERVYHRYLRAPTEVLNKHMSIGFTVPFLNLISQSFAGGNQVGLLTTTFVVTGILNALFVYTVAYHVQLRLTKLAPHTRQHRENVLSCVPQDRADSIHPTRPALTFMFPRNPTCPSAERGGGHDRDSLSRLDRFRKHISDVSTLCTLSVYASDSNGPTIPYMDEETAANAGRPEDALRTLESGTGASTPEPASPRLTRITNAVSTWAKQHIFLTLSILIFLFLGLPLSSLQYTDLPLDIGFLFTIWLSFTSAQTRAKSNLVPLHQRHRKALTAIATLLNPVLWTSLFLLCYGLAKSHIRATPTATVVANFKTGTTVSDLIAHHFTGPFSSSLPPFGAGDIATSILNAGIVSWGLKLFEYRAQLLSRGGLTVLLISALGASFNVVAWPLFAHALGVRPAASSLSFAARSVTIALGGPAMASLGGDAGVNAVGVVVNGIVFQLVAGCFVDGESFEGRMQRWRLICRAQVPQLLWWWSGTGDELSGSDAEKAAHAQRPLQAGCHARYSSDATQVYGRHAAQASPEPHVSTVDDVPTVAAGVTIGINAAAMGTAHLYEQNSHAAPYSALAMTMFGVFTVLFTVQSPMVEWLKGTMV